MPKKNEQTRMPYAMSEQAKEVRKQTLEVFIGNLRGENDTLQRNADSIEGPLYNPVTKTVYTGEKQLAILAQAKTRDGQTITDQRFATFEQVRSIGAHVEKGSKALNIEYWSPMKDKNTGKLMLYATKRGIFNAQDIANLPAEERSFKYNTAEKIRVLDNMATRVEQQIKLQNSYARKHGEPEIALKDKQEFPSRNEYYLDRLTHAAENSARFKNFNRDLEPITPYVDKTGNTKERGGEYLKIDETHSARQSEEPDLAKLRTDYRRYLTELCITQEFGLPQHMLTTFPRQDREKLAEAYEKHPEKFFHDLKAASKTTKEVRENVMFKERERIPEKELTQEMKEAIQKDYRKAYRYVNMEITPMNKTIENMPVRKSEYEEKQISTAKERALNRVDNMTKSIESYGDNELIMKKELMDRIAEARKSLGLESDPAKFTNGYCDLKNKDKEVLILVNSAQIRRENMNHEQILNTFANGTEKTDIMKLVRERASTEAEQKMEKNLKERAADRSKAKAEERAKSKGVWKEKQPTKTRTKSKTRDMGREIG